MGVVVVVAASKVVLAFSSWGNSCCCGSCRCSSCCGCCSCGCCRCCGLSGSCCWECGSGWFFGGGWSGSCCSWLSLLLLALFEASSGIHIKSAIISHETTVGIAVFTQAVTVVTVVRIIVGIVILSKDNSSRQSSESEAGENHIDFLSH